MQNAWLMWWFVAVVVVGFGVLLALRLPHSRIERRRRKSHSRIIAKARRPMVKFSVRPPEEK